MKNLIFLTGFFAVLISCENQNEQISNAPDTVKDYFPMEVGNTWIYEHFRIDLYGNSTRLPLIDSVVVTKDSLIAGNLFYVFEGTDYFRKGKEWSTIGIFKDSADCIVNHKGKIIFSLDNFSDTLHNAVLSNEKEQYAEIIYQMKTPDKQIHVPAGNFTTLNYQGKFIAEDEYIPSGIDNPRFLNTYYGKGVGLVSKNYFYFTGENVFEVKLAKYKLVESEI